MFARSRALSFLMASIPCINFMARMLFSLLAEHHFDEAVETVEDDDQLIDVGRNVERHFVEVFYLLVVVIDPT